MIQETCTRLSERISEVARGQETWTVDEEKHLAGCADCRAEWELAHTARLLAQRADALVEPRVLAEAVTRRLRDATPARRIGRRLRWVGVAVAAAAAMLLVVQTVSAPNTDPIPTVSSDPAEALHLPGLDSLSVDELEIVLASIDQPIEAFSTFDSSEWNALDDHELERLLREWEG
ncbi:MAG: hypothetical protein HKM89_02860 [Gemmatimonadales bacterium]|nr:hypothetical protein [Gemmatimonadales bacterium]